MIIGTLFMVGTKLQAQQATNREWLCPVIGGNNGFFVKHYYISNELNKVVETSTGRGDQFDSVPMELECAAPDFENGVERFFPIYSGTYSIITFRNISDQSAEVSICYQTFQTLDEAKNYEAPNESFQKWYSNEGYNAEMEKPTIQTMSKKDVIDFLKFCKTLIDTAKVNSPQLDKQSLQTLISYIMTGAALKYAREKGFNEFKSMPVIQRGVQSYADDKQVKEIVESFKID